MQSSCAINPWSTSAEVFSKNDLCWDVDDFKTPFAALSHLIQTWPGPTQTSEQTKKIRHQRLVETIAGYPEIASGRRPLDMPFHSKSVIAFKLSNFLDKIPGPPGHEWHSLKTALLHFDLREHENMPVVKFFHHMMVKIRENTTYLVDGEKTRYQRDVLHPDEIEFITVLHSQNQENAAYWPSFDETQETLEFDNLDNDKAFTAPTRIFHSEDRNNFVPHEFKFKKIQSWIKKWTECTSVPNSWLEKNSSQHLIVGASVMLESVLAKMRSYILKEKRPGSIIVDGGGRLRYLSKNTPDEEAKWFENHIESIFLLDQHHLHPYQDLISDGLESYMHAITEQLRSSHPFDQYILGSFFKKTTGTSHKLSSEGYNLLIGRDKTRHFLPEISKGQGRVLDDGSVEYDSLFSLSEIDKPQEFEKCVLCHPHGGRPGGRAAENTIKGIINSGQFVCPFHSLLYTVGKKAKIRLQSQPDLFTHPSRRLQDSEKGVQKMLMFDGNAIGQLFNQPFEDWKAPSASDIPTNMWNANKKDAMDIHRRWDANGIPIKGWRTAFSRRMQAMLRVQRRSFSFNSYWWLSLRKALKETKEASMVPWIMAGDDIVMVNHLGVSDSAIKEMLSSFQHNLQCLFPDDIPICFAGSLQHRDDGMNIIDMYERARRLEEIAGYLWKWHTNNLDINEKDGWNLVHESKIKKLDAWLENNHDLKKQFSGLMDLLISENYTYQSMENGCRSLILSNEHLII